MASIPYKLAHLRLNDRHSPSEIEITNQGLQPRVMNTLKAEAMMYRHMRCGGHPPVSGQLQVESANKHKEKVAALIEQTKDACKAKLYQFAHEAIIWGQLSHPNLLPIYGLYRYNSRFCFVSPWMESGTLPKILLHNPDVSRILLASDIAEGVAYLYKEDIIHGDLKGENILTDSAGRARVADFGVATVSDGNIPHWTSHSMAASKGGSTRWQAPEIFSVGNDELVFNSKASDVYAWSCVCYEIFTGNVPFVEHVHDSTVTLKVMAGIQPSRPSVTSPAWSYLKRSGP